MFLYFFSEIETYDIEVELRQCMSLQYNFFILEKNI